MSDHPSFLILEAHLADPKATVASIGVIYGMLIAANPRLDSDDWVRVHGKISAFYGLENGPAWFKKMDQIKKCGWRLYDAACDLSLRNTDQKGSGDE